LGPIPNPQSPTKNSNKYKKLKNFILIKNK